MTFRRMIFLWALWVSLGSALAIPVAWTMATIMTTPGPQPAPTPFRPRQQLPPLLAPSYPPEPSEAPPVVEAPRPSRAPRITAPKTTEATREAPAPITTTEPAPIPTTEPVEPTETSAPPTTSDTPAPCVEVGTDLPYLSGTLEACPPRLSPANE